MTGVDALLALAVGALFVVEFAFVIRRWPVVFVWLLTGVVVLDSYAVMRDGVRFGAVQVYAVDVIAAAGAVSLLLSVNAARRSAPALKLIIGLFVLAMLRGVVAFGPETAGNGARVLFAFLVATGFAAQRSDVDLGRAIRGAWRAASGIFVATALVFLARNGFGTYASSGARPLSAPQALVLSQAGLTYLADSGRRSRVLAAVCLAAVLVSQQRTVWFASVAGLLALTLQPSRSLGAAFRRRLSGARRYLLVAAVLGGVLIVIGPEGLRNSTNTATSSATAESGTLSWRLEGWDALLDDYVTSDVVDQVVGRAAGSGFDRVVGGVEVSVTPHSMYVTLLVSLGFLGFGGYLLLLARALQLSARRESSLWALLWTLAVFGVGYQLSAEQGLLLGLALGMGSRAVSETGRSRSLLMR